jgi:hypothetical protein
MFDPWSDPTRPITNFPLRITSLLTTPSPIPSPTKDPRRGRSPMGGEVSDLQKTPSLMCPGGICEAGHRAERSGLRIYRGNFVRRCIGRNAPFRI